MNDFKWPRAYKEDPGWHIKGRHIRTLPPKRFCFSRDLGTSRLGEVRGNNWKKDWEVKEITAWQRNSKNFNKLNTEREDEKSWKHKVMGM